MKFTSYTSNLITDALNAAEIKALNSFSFSDLSNMVNKEYEYAYERVAQIDAGYFSSNMRLSARMTTLPPFVKNTVCVYAAQHPVGFSRDVFRHSGNRDINSHRTFNISGMDLWCPDAAVKTVWVEFVPEPKMLHFPHHNRDPKIITDYIIPSYNVKHDEQWMDDGVITNVTTVDNTIGRYGMYKIFVTEIGNAPCIMAHYMPYTPEPIPDVDLTPVLCPRWVQDSNDPWELTDLFLDYPYIFASYKDMSIPNDDLGPLDTGIRPDVAMTLREYRYRDARSVVFKDVLSSPKREEYNCFDFNGRPTRVRYMKASYNDETGMGVTVFNQEDQNLEAVVESGVYVFKSRVCELGWCCDTLITYPSRIMYNYMLFQLAKRFSSKNSSSIPYVEEQLVLTEREMNVWLRRNQSGFVRINNVNGPTMSDVL